MEDGQRKQERDHPLEDACFVGNSLNKEVKFESTINSSESKPCSLLRAPSLPHNLGQVIEEDEDDDEDGPRMGDLIRQAMPCKLERAPSLPPCRIRKESDVGIPRGPTVGKLTRRSSMDPSLFLQHKLPSKSKGSSASRSMEGKRVSKPQNLERSPSLKGLSDKEVLGFQDLGFTFDKEDLDSTVAAKLASLEMKGKPYGKGVVSDANNATEGSESPPMAKWAGTKSSAADLKAQIKFWARAVASNVQPD